MYILYKIGEFSLLSNIRLFIYHIKENFFLETSRWGLWLPVLFSFGIGFYFSLSFEPSKWFTLLFFELLLVLIFLYRRNYTKLFIIGNVFVIVFGFSFASVHSYYISRQVFPPEKEEQLYLKAKISKIEYNYQGKQRLYIENIRNFDDKDIKGIYRLTIMSENKSLKNGDCVEMVANIGKVTKPFIVGGYMPNKQTFFEKISATGYVSSRVLPIECENKTNMTSSFVNYINNLRKKYDTEINAVLEKDVASVVSAIAVGERGGISVSLNEQYRDSGLAHFLSISGLHMSMLTGLMFFFMRFIFSLLPWFVSRFDSKKISAVVAMVLSFGYLLISGMEIPAQRAFIMTTIVLLGVLLDRTAISMRVIAIAAFCILIFSPEALLSPSFQMSFSATVALIAFYEHYALKIRRFVVGEDGIYNSFITKMFKIFLAYMLGILLTDLVASVTTSVFAVHNFNRLSIYTTIGNLLSGPIIGFVIMPFLLFSILLLPFGLAEIPLKITGFGVSLVNDITRDVSSLPNASILLPSFSSFGLVLMSIGGLWLCIWQQKWRRWGLLFIVLGFSSVFWQRIPDILINEEKTVVAVKDVSGDIVVLPSKKNNILKKIWQEKTASRVLSKKEKKDLKNLYENGEDLDWIDLKCHNKYCDYKKRVRIYKDGRLFDLDKKKDIKLTTGASIWISIDELEVVTIDEYMGNRLWSVK